MCLKTLSKIIVDKIPGGNVKYMNTLRVRKKYKIYTQLSRNLPFTHLAISWKISTIYVDIFLCIKMKKICIVEDDIGISTSLKLYLENSDFEVITYESWHEAVEFILSSSSDLVILDINLPVIDGVSVCKSLREKSTTPVIMLTARDWEIDKVTGLEAWADDYIAKPFSPRELLARIKSILRRSQDEQETLSWVIAIGNIEIDTEKTELRVAGNTIALTKNEFDILEKIVRAKWSLVTRESLMKEVIGYDNYVYDRTIDTHIKNLRKKLWNKDLIITIRGKWYRFNI